MKRPAVASACALSVLVAFASMGDSSAAPTRRDVGPNASPLYEKECGSCHFPYQPGWLPQRSWQRVMGSLSRHFGENAEVSAANRDAISAYLAAGAADRADNVRSRELMAAIAPGETPTSVTGVLYVGGIHGGFLDPKFQGQPEVKTLAQCPACHQQADRGWFAPVTYTITDEGFRSNEVDLSASLPVPSFLRIGK
jgi:hypothetical protein